MHRFFKRQPREPAKHVVKVKFAPDKIEIHAFFETSQHVFGGDFAVKQRFQHEIEAFLSAPFHDALVSAPTRDIVHILFDTRNAVDSAIDFFARIFFDDAKEIFECGFRFLFGFVSAHIVFHKDVRLIFRQPTAGFVEKIEVAIGVQCACGVVKRGHRRDFVVKPHIVFGCGEKRCDFRAAFFDGFFGFRNDKQEFQKFAAVVFVDGRERLFHRLWQKRVFLHCFFDLGGRDVFGILSVLILVFFRDKPVATSRFEIRFHKTFRVFDGAGVFKIFCDFFVGREFVRQEIQRLQLFAGERNRSHID